MASEKETSRDFVNGNTNSLTKSQPLQLIYWFFTFNNYTSNDIEILETRFKEICVKYIFQEETGESGTKHLQGSIHLKKKMRWSEFDLNKNIHWEKIRNKECAFNYCSKEQTRTGNVYSMGIRAPVKLITPDRTYQQFIIKIINDAPDDRSIYWFYEENGNVGKSALCKYLVVKHNAIYIDEGKKTDIMNTIYSEYQKGRNIDLVIIDIPRANGNNVSYKSIESIKNGLIYSPKYEGGFIAFNPCHVFIFCNESPDTSFLSMDRWKIFEILENYDYKRC